MQYLGIGNLESGMVLARPIMGETGSLLVNSGHTITPTILRRMESMGFQGAYIEREGFSDIIVEDVIPDDLRAGAFEALRTDRIEDAVSDAKKMVQELKYKETLKLDLLDIKNDKNYIFKHCVSVAVFAIVVGIGYGMNEEQLENLAVAGLLHDIGKLEVKKRVLNSKHIFNEKDMDEMKKHPMYSYEILKEYPWISSVSRNSILFHHENLDGSGYYGITEEKIGVFPRILRVVDSYDALTAQKKYRDAASPAAAIEYIMSQVGTMYDETIVDIFIKKFPVYPIGFTVRLSNGEIAVIVNNEIDPLRPIVRKMDGTDIILSSDIEYRKILIEEFM